LYSASKNDPPPDKSGNIINFDKFDDMVLTIHKDNNWEGCKHKFRKEMNFHSQRLEDTLKLCSNSPTGIGTMDNLVLEYVEKNVYNCYTKKEWENIQEFNSVK